MKLYNVFVPTSPNPTTGIMLTVSMDRVLPVDLSVDKGMQITVSAGFTGNSEKK